jgi:hypothetical protein
MVGQANLKQSCVRFSTITVVLFVLCFAWQAACAEEIDAAPVIVNTKTAPPNPHISTRPFSQVAMGVTVGTLGGGVELVTTMSRRTNLRVDGHYFGISENLTQDGVGYNGKLQMADARLSYDYYPFGGGLRLSAGAAVYNKFSVKAVASVPSARTITFNNVDYYSSATDPLKGNGTIDFSHKVAPTASFGWGNAIPRSNRHLAFPLEIGVAFTGAPAFDLNMTGSACSSPDPATCSPVATNSEFKTNLAAERTKINNDIAPLRFYPIVNLGMTYRF